MEIKDLIPQREPFLFIESISNIAQDSINVSMSFSPDMDFFKGHFPDNPIVPGVILAEHCFQSGAALIAFLSKSEKNRSKGLAVVSRIQSAKFKNIVRPGDTLNTTTSLLEKIGSAAFFRSVTKSTENKKILLLDFSCTIIEPVDKKSDQIVRND